MSGPKMEINVSGGNVSFGNVNQGDSATQHSSQEVNIQAEHLDEFFKTIDSIQQQNNIDADQLAALKQQVEELASNSSDSGLAESFKDLYEKYSWAIEPLKKLALVVMA